MKLITLLALAITLSSCGSDKDGAITSSPFMQGSERNTETNAITNEFGALVVSEGEFTYEASTKPWSSWWFPSIDRFLFDRSDVDAPLIKYDNYVERKHNIKARSAEFEENELFNPSQAPWAGLCHAWAVASVLHREPDRIIQKQNLTFDVADQKALLLKSYESVGNLKIYGDRYDGQHNDNFDDIYPDQFHRFAQIHLLDQKKPFIMDYDPSYPVWTVPVYKIKFKVTRDSASSAQVKAWVTIASPFVKPNFIGTRGIVKTYTYNLYGEWKGSQFFVVDSEWTDLSIFDHPDYVIAYPKDAKKGSYNKQLNVEMISEILSYDSN